MALTGLSGGLEGIDIFYQSMALTGLSGGLEGFNSGLGDTP
jgi:hypothetical protein